MSHTDEDLPVLTPEIRTYLGQQARRGQIKRWGRADDDARREQTEAMRQQRRTNTVKIAELEERLARLEQLLGAAA